MENPQVGRSVHYVDHGGKHRVAFIAELDPFTIVWYRPQSNSWVQEQRTISFNEKLIRGTWHYTYNCLPRGEIKEEAKCAASS